MTFEHCPRYRRGPNHCCGRAHDEEVAQYTGFSRECDKLDGGVMHIMPYVAGKLIRSGDKWATPISESQRIYEKRLSKILTPGSLNILQQGTHPTWVMSEIYFDCPVRSDF